MTDDADEEIDDTNEGFDEMDDPDEMTDTADEPDETSRDADRTDERSDGTAETAAETPPDDPETAGGTEPAGRDEQADPPAGDDESDRTGPMADLARELDERDADIEDLEGPMAELAGEMAGDLDVDLAELFEERDAADVDSEALWEQVTEETPGATVEPEPDEYERRVVPKSDYCARCEHFSSPPDVGCTYEGSHIEEVIDYEHFAVVNCPVVREDEELEGVGE